MDRETYIAPFIKDAFQEQSAEIMLAIMRQFWAFFDALGTATSSDWRFDSITTGMVESDSREKPVSTPIL